MIEIFKQLFAVFNAEGLAGYRNLMKFAIAVSATRGARLYDVVIWDEGMISLTQHAARYEGADRAFGRLWRMWDSEHIICVIVDLPLDVAMTRLRNRYASRLSRFSDEELLERFGPGREVVLRLSNKLAKIQSQNILIVDGTVSPERSSGIVTDFLLPRLQRCKSLASDS
jgi:thymidylate kinase